MKTRMRLQGFVLGVVLTVLTSTLVVPAMATAADVLFNSVNITVDGQQIAAVGESYTLANGTQTPNSIVYNSTTYLPIRRISEILGKDIDWDGSTSTVVIGAAPATPTPTPTPSAQYYPGTSYQTFTSVTGTPLNYTHTYDDGTMAYLYSYEEDASGRANFVQYMDYLISQGFAIFEYEEDGETLSVMMTRGNELFGLFYDIVLEIVIIPPM